MSSRAAARLAWLLWLLFVLTEAASLSLRARNDLSTLAIDGFGALVQLTFVTVGAFIVSRRPQNAIGWIFVASALLEAASELILEYAVYSLITAPGNLPGGAWAAYAGDALRSVPFLLTAGYVLLLFPDGRLPSRRWRPVGWLPVIGLAAYVPAEALASAPNDLRLPSVPNPLGVHVDPAISGLLYLLFIVAIGASVIIGAAATIVRFRRANGDERQQIKWFAYAAVVCMCQIVGLLAAVVLNLNIGSAVTDFLFPLAVAGIPVATGIAILKYRLYAIDLLIRRTLLYGLLTALLALVYFGSVVALQSTFIALTGAARSELVTVLSTLAIAALFVPLRRRLQAAVDRRFNRQKYDAAQTLARFGATLRDDVNLEDLSARLLGVVDETMQPENVTLWLAKDEQ